MANSSNSTTNMTTDTAPALPITPLQLKFNQVMLCVRLSEGALAIGANLLTLICVVLYRGLRTPAGILISSLALNDFVHGLIMLLVFPFRNVSSPLCTISQVAESFTILMELLIFALIAIERWKSLQFQLNRSNRFSVTSVSVILSIGLVIALAYEATLAGTSTKIQPTVDQPCTARGRFNRAVVNIGLTLFMLCFVTVVVFYCSIAQIAHGSQNRVRANGTNPQQLERQRRDLQITRMMALVIGLFFLLNIPGFTSYATMPKNPRFWRMALNQVLICIFEINFWINPLIYGWRNQQFRKAFKHFLGRCCPQTGNHPTITQPSPHQRNFIPRSPAGITINTLATKTTDTKTPSQRVQSICNSLQHTHHTGTTDNTLKTDLNSTFSPSTGETEDNQCRATNTMNKASENGENKPAEINSADILGLDNDIGGRIVIRITTAEINEPGEQAYKNVKFINHGRYENGSADNLPPLDD